MIAITREESKFKAVIACTKEHIFEVVFTKSADIEETTLHQFVQDLNDQEPDISEKIIAVGFNSTGVIFYHIEVPDLNADELTSLIQLQVEARLPLPVEQMELTWRTGKAKKGNIAVTIAAAKKEHLLRFVTDINSVRPARIILDCEALVKTWTTVFAGNAQEALLLSIGSQSTQVCLTENGQLTNAVNLDMGTDDFSNGQPEVTDRFIQDIKSVLNLFGLAESDKTPAFILSDGKDMIEEIAAALSLEGLNVQTVSPQLKSLNIENEDIYEYRTAIGLALMSLEISEDRLDIFENLYQPAKKGGKRRWLYSPKLAGTLAVIMAILFFVVFYITDAASLKAMEKHFHNFDNSANCTSLVERQKLIKAIALQRPDVLKLLSEINSGENNGITLDSFTFKKGQTITISGQADDDEKLYKFQVNLLSKKSITEVKIQSTKKGEKDKKLTFTMNFHYKSFTTKKKHALSVK